MVPYLPALAAEELARVLNDLLVCEEAVGLLLAQHKHLPQGHPERPHVTGRGELALEEEKGEDLLSPAAPAAKPFHSAPCAAQHEGAPGEMLQKELPATHTGMTGLLVGQEQHVEVPQELRRCSFHRGKAL